MQAKDELGQAFKISSSAGRSTSAISRREIRVRHNLWVKLKKVAGRIPFANDALAAYYCAIDTDTPIRVKGILLGSLVYFIAPADAIPDIIAGIGFTDDATVLAMVLNMLSTYIKPRHRLAATKAFNKNIRDNPGAA